MSLELPVGEPVETPGTPGRPRRRDYEGRYVRLSPVDAARDGSALYACSHGDAGRERLWTYMGYGPFADGDAMTEWLASLAEGRDPVFLTVRNVETDRLCGMVSYLNIVPDAWRLELGHIWYAPEAQRTAINTEAIYLMLCETFETLRYRRAEWKCDALNARSRAAALRLGFSYEGLFRQHLIVKGRNRDTAWFAMMDSEWPRVKGNMERWLYENPDGKLSLGEMNAVPA